DKNIVSGESLCRHLLYTRKYVKEKFGLEPEDIKIDWSPDTFGHAYTIPSILKHGGVNRYYFHRTGPGKWLTKWRSADGSEVYAYKDKDKYAYNGPIDPMDMGAVISDYVKETGLKDFMYVYGVGDHGGGPTRKDLRKAMEIKDWPIFPTVKMSTTNAFFDAVEAANPDLPVTDSDMNFIFEGCYTAQSNIKRANRVSEIILPEAETLSLIAGAVAGFPYPSDTLLKAWENTLFNHFHDILPGSGIHATYEYSQGLFQEIQATAGSIRTRALRGLTSKINTAAAANAKPTTFGAGLGDGLGAGVGDTTIPGGITGYNAGAASAEPFVIYNQKPWARSEMVYAKVWNKEVLADKVVVRDSNGNEFKGQVMGHAHYWGHNYTTVAFNAKVPALGYNVYAIDNAVDPITAEGACIKTGMYDVYGNKIPSSVGSSILENEFLKVQVDWASGAICSMIDKETGVEYVPDGKLLGLIEGYQETPHGMTSWCIGQATECTPLIQGGDLHVTHNGPNRVAVRTTHKYRNSRVTVEIGLNAGSRMVDFDVRLHWVEIGTPETGVPMLKAAFPLNAKPGATATYEIPFGSQQRPQSAQEVPALKWADISGKTEEGKAGITLVNDSKYGHSCNENTLRLTLIRSSYDPDPLPEVADHTIKFAVVPHAGECDVIAATRLGEEFNSPVSVASATVQDGPLPAEKSFVEVLTPEVMVSTVKKAEASDGLVIRMYNMTGNDTVAKVKISDLVKAGAAAKETDTLERPVSANTAKMDGDTLSVAVPGFSNTTVVIG
ncbi:glycosyl hydrolase-related protein, partial [bacterium]|nr:glycosyl hydrolase-related protein [bacterium]